MIKKAFLAGIVFGCLVTPLYAALLITGNATVPNQTFNFALGSHAFYNPTGRLFVGASEALGKNDYALAAVSRQEKAFKKLAPERVRLDYVPDSENPLFGAGIKYLALLAQRPLVALKHDPLTLFLVDDSTTAISVFKTSHIHNADGKDPVSLLGITTTAPDLLTALEPGATLGAFAAVSNHRGTFDGDGSGIALMFFRRFVESETKSFFKWDIVDAQTGASQYTVQGNSTGGGNKAFPVGKDTPELAVEHPLAMIGSKMDLFFDRDLGRLYVALNVVAGGHDNDGARAVLVASVVNGRIALQPIVPDSAIDHHKQIVAGRGAGAALSVHKVRTMQTTTYLRYLIVVGCNGTKARKKVFALPLVDNIKSGAHGTLADVRSLPTTIFAEPKPHIFQTRVFTKAATSPDELYTMNSPHAQVGGNSQLPGPINDISVNSDAVFVSVTKDGHGLKAGIFKSQALFDRFGRIREWTQWQRVAGVDSTVAFFSYDPYKGQFLYDSNTGSGTEIFRTQFDHGESDVSIFVAQRLPQSQGGVQGLFDFPETTAGFSEIVGERLSVNVFTGFEKIIMMQAGQDSNGTFGPVRKIITFLDSHDGSLAQFDNEATLVLAGGAIKDIGPISSCTTVTDRNFGWFVVGGSYGVALLADATGAGWDAKKGLMTSFQGLTKLMAFRKISNVKNVRKLVAQGNNLFILTDTVVQRISLTAATIQVLMNKNTSQNYVATLATLTQEQQAHFSSFSDLIVSGPLALLATSFGLMRSGNGVDIQTVPLESAVAWQPIELPESSGTFCGAGPVTRLFAISPNGKEQDVAQGGNIYAINGSISMSQTQIYRLTLALKEEVTDKTVRLLPDLFIPHHHSFFAALGDYRNYVVTDGALIAISRSAFGACRSLLELLSPTLKSGQPGGARSRVVFTTFSMPALSIGQMIRDSASGSWIVPGDFGIQIQQ